MDLLDKKLKRQEETTDGIGACNLINYLAKRAEGENREKIMGSLMRFAAQGLAEFHCGHAVARIVEAINEPDADYGGFLIPFVFKKDFPLECKANIIVRLSRATNNTFELGKPIDASFWKESDIDYEATWQWAEEGFPYGNDYEDPAHPINWLIQAEAPHLDQIRRKWDLPEYYPGFLTKASPLNANLNLREYGRITVYGAQNLIKAQNGYCFNPVTQKEINGWNRNYLVIADRSMDPFCIDLSLEQSPVYFALHGRADGNFQSHLKIL